MKILVTSDTHGSIGKVLNYINKNKNIELVIHLGDYIEDGLEIERITGKKTLIVAGNGDDHSNYDRELLIEIGGYKFFLSHGHLYSVSNGLEKIYYRGLELGADLVLFGHSHLPVNIEEDLIIFNPGSPTYPRTLSREKTIGLLDLFKGLQRKIISL